MASLSASITLRPARIALLVRPTDLTSIRRFMRICACLWGGVYNPIIPVFRQALKEWCSKYAESVKGYAVARGYIEFFEPDAFVEAEDGLLEEAGLGLLRINSGWQQEVIPLRELFSQPYRKDWSEPRLGLSIMDVFQRVYDEERRFQLRDQRPAFLVRPQPGTALVEAIFGVYPTQKSARHIGNAFEDVYRPEKLTAGVDAWRKIFRSGAEVPLRVTRYGVEAIRNAMHDLVVFVFDPEKAVDLIDLWNIRLESNPIIPVPLTWFADLAGDIRDALIAENRPLQGNAHGVMHRATIEFSRSIDERRAKSLLEHLKPMPKDSLIVKSWRNPIWIRSANGLVRRDRRLEVVAKEQRVSLAFEEGDAPTARFENISPDFAGNYAGYGFRWVNAVKLSSYGKTNIATVIPFNTFDWHWPRLDFLGGKSSVGGDGWVFGQKFKDSTQTIQLHTHESIIIGALKHAGIKAKLSEPGHIARQVLEHLGGLWGVHLLAEKETLQLLNAMAVGLRRRIVDGLAQEEVFDRRSKPLKDWQNLIARRKQIKRLPLVKLEDFTSRNIIRLGVQTKCTHCEFMNWHSLSSANYQLSCERCLKIYDFPQASILDHNRNWVYRVIGPFSVPDYARGSYGALLALRALTAISGSREEMTFSTALSMNFDGMEAEVDFVAIRAQQDGEYHKNPEMIVGEAKSFGEGELIKSRDLSKLKEVSSRIPGVFIVIAVMRDEFTPNEKSLLRRFVKWARRPNDAGGPTNLVILLTGKELFYRFTVSSTWKDIGGRHAEFSDYQHTRSLKFFSESTQAIYLDLPPYHEERRTFWEKRMTRKNAKKTGARP